MQDLPSDRRDREEFRRPGASTGVVGRKAGSYPGYHYSEANEKSGITWDEADLKEYLKDPKRRCLGPRWSFPACTDEKDIDDVIAYLKQFGPDGKKI